MSSSSPTVSQIISNIQTLQNEYNQTCTTANVGTGKTYTDTDSCKQAKYNDMLSKIVQLNNAVLNANAADIQDYLNQRSTILAQLLTIQSNLADASQATSASVAAQTEIANQYSSNIAHIRTNLNQQQNELENKKKILETRNRMLQIAREKNLYKKKMVYTLLSVLFVLVLILFVLYITFKVPNS